MLERVTVIEKVIRNFMMCGDCYWCASGIRIAGISKCPQCERLLSVIPISAKDEKEALLT
jgi:hypothetical protein